MRVVEITEFGKPEVLRVGERPMPQTGPGEVLVKVLAAGVNRPDILQRAGAYPPPAGASDVPGITNFIGQFTCNLTPYNNFIDARKSLSLCKC